MPKKAGDTSRVDGESTESTELADLSLDDILFDEEPDAGDLQEAEELGNELAENESEEAEESEEEDSEDETDSEEDGSAEEADSGDDSDEEAIPYIVKRLGLEGIDPKKYEDDYDGVLSLVNDATEAMTKASLEKTFGKHPLLKQFHDFLNDGGDPGRFLQVTFPQDNWEAVELAEDDVVTAAHILKVQLEKDGLSQEEINEEIDDYKTAGMLHKHALRALSKLQKGQQTEKKRVLKEAREAAATIEQERQEYRESIQKLLGDKKKADFRGITIPLAERDAFFEYMTAQVGENDESQLALDNAKLEPEQELALYYLIYKGVDLSDIVVAQAKKENAKSLSDKLRKDRDGKRKLRGRNDVPTRTSDVDAAVESVDIAAL